MRNIAYQNTTDDPDFKGTDTARSFTTTVNDGIVDSDPVTSAVNVAGVNDAAVLDDSAVTDGTYTEGGPAVGILDGVELSDADSETMSGARVQINNVRPGDELVFKPGYELPEGLEVGV